MTPPRVKFRVDLIDAHVYGGALLLALAAGAWHWTAGVAVFGVALFYLGLRRPS